MTLIREEIVDLLFAVKSIKETDTSPDGRGIGWAEYAKNPDRTASTDLLIFRLDPGEETPKRVTADRGVGAAAARDHGEVSEQNLEKSALIIEAAIG